MVRNRLALLQELIKKQGKNDTAAMRRVNDKEKGKSSAGPASDQDESYFGISPFLILFLNCFSLARKLKYGATTKLTRESNSLPGRDVGIVSTRTHLVPAVKFDLCNMWSHVQSTHITNSEEKK